MAIDFDPPRRVLPLSRHVCHASDVCEANGEDLDQRRQFGHQIARPWPPGTVESARWCVLRLQTKPQQMMRGGRARRPSSGRGLGVRIRSHERNSRPDRTRPTRSEPRTAPALLLAREMLSVSLSLHPSTAFPAKPSRTMRALTGVVADL